MEWITEILISNVWIVCLIVLLGGIFTFFFGQKAPLQGASVTLCAMGAGYLLSVLIFIHIYLHPESTIDKSFTWFSTSGGDIMAGFLLDPLTAIMLLVVTLVSLLVQIYSTSYMHGDKGYSRYFAYLSTFSFAMLLLVIANNFFIMYIAWELVGLFSYLLIGFWYEKKSASDAAKKAFITTKVGDIGFLLGILLLYSKAHTFHFAGLYAAIGKGVESGAISSEYLTVSLILLFGGAVGKSAQFPLHVWLPDAMEGPTPVSALIHAATMVAAGVYLVARAFPLFLLSKTAILFVAYTGAITAIFAALIAVVMCDIKKVLAYSTISQLGIMMLGLGVGGYVPGLFHLVTHAFFKALLFLGAGSVIHSLHSQDIREMGGLMKTMRITGATFLLGCLSIAGIPPFAGFYSKDAILVDIFELVYAEPQHFLLFFMAAGTTLLTAFYMFRLFFMVFLGEPRGSHSDPHESPLNMTFPLVILAVLAGISGIFAGNFASFLGHGQSHSSQLLSKGSHQSLGRTSSAVSAFPTQQKFSLSSDSKTIQSCSHQSADLPSQPGFKSSIFVKPHFSVDDAHSFEKWVTIASVGLAFLGIILAFLLYWPPEPIILPDDLLSFRLGAFVYKVLTNKFYIDEIYSFVFVGGANLIAGLLSRFDSGIVDGLVNMLGFQMSLFSLAQAIWDKYVIDGMVNGVGRATAGLGRSFSHLQNGLVQNYLFIIMTFVVGTLLVLFRASLF
ncbi:MAG: NADH-quinone oxidoreductase subunit L [Candidatus Riflebacteria bacterium]|nr:NADH-quinone oxidoreductase subunit L [Candidatus Riflebacteria bacterium]